jgi:hypothetical protein
VCFGEGRWEAAAHYLEESVAVGIIGPFSWTLFAPSVLAECDLLEGNAGSARARLAPLLATADHGEADVSLLLAPYAWAHLELGDVAEAAAIIGPSIAQAHTQNDRLTLVDALRVQALLAIRKQRWTAAEQALEEGLTLARGMPHPYAEARLLHLYGALHMQKGEPEQVRARLEGARAIFRRIGARRDIERVEHEMAALPARSV